jgi:hypothetical protein
MSFWKWSRVASSNATADSTINWAEGQAPSSVNDSARALMAAAAKYRDDTAGALALAGTSTAYTVASYQGFDTLAHMDGAKLVVVPNVTNGASPTLNVDSLGAVAINISDGVAVPSGFMLANSPYALVYKNASNEWILFNAFGVLPALTGSSLTLASATISGVLTLSSTGYMILPTGTTAQRPGSPVAGYLRFNTDLSNLDVFDGGAWRQPSQAQPIAAGFKNLLIQNNAGTPDTKIDITADAVTVETTGGTAYRKSSISVTVNCTTTGANGLDTGSLANNTWYYLWIIYNPSTDTIAGLASTSSTAPTMPSGYTAKARLGANRTGGSATFNRVRQLGRRAQYVVTAGSPTPNLPSMSSGTQTQWTAVATGSFVPSTASMIAIVGVAVSSASASATVSAAPNNAYTSVSSTAPPPLSYTAPVASSGSYSTILTLESTNIYVAMTQPSTGATSVSALGWEDNI